MPIGLLPAMFLANWANQLPDDEDPMPPDGNPHSLPGQLQPYNVNFVLPPYPALGWNEVPNPPAEDPQVEPQDNWGHAQWGDEPVIEEIHEPMAVPEPEEQLSMILDHPRRILTLLIRFNRFL